MTQKSDDGSEPFGAAEVRERLDWRLADARKSYEQVVNRLWAGNAAGVAAVLSIIEKSNVQKCAAIVALTVFGGGLLTLAIASFSSLVRQSQIVKSLESANSILDIRADFAKRPSEDSGLSWLSFSTWMVLVSMLMFIIGAISFICALFKIIQ